MRRARFQHTSQDIRAAISGFGSIASSQPGGGATAVSHSQATPTTTQSTNQRARWGDRSPRLPAGAERTRQTGRQSSDFFTCKSCKARS